MILFCAVVGLMVVLAVVSWFDYRRNGGKPGTDEDPFDDAPSE